MFVCTGDGTIRTFSEEGGGESVPVADKDFSYSGSYQIINDSTDSEINWRIKFLSSGIFKPLKVMTIDVFLVGGGGGWMSKDSSQTGCGGGGYTTTVKSILLEKDTEYTINIGSGGNIRSYSYDTSSTVGGTSSAFNATAAGGKYGYFYQNGGYYQYYGGDGGSGGAAYMQYCSGGIDGANGGDYTYGGSTTRTQVGKGQGTTTREFGESTGDLYASGGGTNITSLVANSGNGGRNDNTASTPKNTTGASGIVIIRNSR